MGRAIDLFITYRFIRLLTTPFNKQEAYKLGIIDENGTRTDKEIETPDEKSAYTILHKLVFNIKRILGKIPILKTKLGTYAAALFLLKDTFKEEKDFREIEKYLMEEILKNPELLSNTIKEEYEVLQGKYILETETLLSDLETYAKIGDEIFIPEGTEPTDTVLGIDVYPAIHIPTNKTIYITIDDIG
jgi:hypothetical protein